MSHFVFRCLRMWYHESYSRTAESSDKTRSPAPTAPHRHRTTTNRPRSRAKRAATRHDALLFERYHATRDPRTRAELVARWLPLAKRLARGYGGRDEYDDLVQVASVALIKADRPLRPRSRDRVRELRGTDVVGELKRHFRDHCWSVKRARATCTIARSRSIARPSS